MWLSRNRQKIAELEAEVKELREYAPKNLYALLQGKSEQFKNQFYVAMLRISVAADVVNEACEVAKEMFKTEFGCNDFSLIKEVIDMAKLSHTIASFPIGPSQDALMDVIVDDEELVKRNMKLATKHIVSKLRIKDYEEWKKK